MRYEPPQSLADIPTVTQLVQAADATVAGLEQPKRWIALLLRRHMVAALTGAHVHIPNLLIAGPSGGGKTHLLTTMLDACPVPWSEGNITEYSPSGFRGRDLPTVYADLTGPRWAGVRGSGDLSWTQREMMIHAQRYGVVVLDEFDKLRIPPGQPKAGEKDFGSVIQAELLKLVEGAEVDVKRYDGDRGFHFRTHGVLHIAMGAFDGLDRVIAQLNEIDNPTPQDLLSLLTNIHTIDIIKYGFLSELVGRFATIIPFPPLSSEAMARILTEHVIPNYRLQMQAEGIDLVVEDGAIAWIAGESVKSKVGARSIEPLMEELLRDRWAEAQRGDTIAISASSAASRTSELWPRHVDALRALA